MLKRLTLLRHAKSSWKDPDLDDFERPLNGRGNRDAPMMGERLLARGARPSLFLTSNATRARETARLIAKAIGFPVEFLQSEPELYLATADEMLALLAQQPDEFNDMLVCAHNPGITELANRLTGAGIDNIPTCGIVAMQAEIPGWKALNDGVRFELMYFDYPKAADLTQVTKAQRI